MGVRSFTGSYQGKTKVVQFSFEMMNDVVIEATYNMGWMIGKPADYVRPRLRQYKARVIEVTRDNDKIREDLKRNPT